jgi:palmitoyl-protein thioesterase
MAGPQMGQWGQCTMNRTDIPDEIAKKMTRPLGWVVFYNPVAQHELSIANYWHDPEHEAKMIHEAALLPSLNGYDPNVDMTHARERFLALDKAVFFGSEDDNCINPPLSAVFQFVDKNGTQQRVEDSLEYQNDTFGLRTMMDQGRLILNSIPGLGHLSWRKPQVFEKYVLPHLLEDPMMQQQQRGIE